MELREYLRLWYLSVGERPLSGWRWLLAVQDRDTEIELCDAAQELGFTNYDNIKNSVDRVITPKGLEFIKNGT